MNILRDPQHLRIVLLLKQLLHQHFGLHILKRDINLSDIIYKLESFFLYLELVDLLDLVIVDYWVGDS